MLNEIFNAENKLVWLDLVQPSTDEIEKIDNDYQIKIPDKSSLEELSHLNYRNEIMLLSVPNVVAMDSDENPEPICFIIKNNILITIRFLNLPSFEKAKIEIEKQSISNGFDIFSLILAEIIKAGGSKLEELNTQTTNLSFDIFRCTKQPNRNVSKLNKHLRHSLYKLGICGEKASLIREIQLGLQRIIPYVLQEMKGKLSEKTISDLETARKDLESLTDFEAHLSDRIHFLLDAILGFINIEQNDIFKVLTIVSVVGIPPTFIASWYGMNFHYLPEYTWIHGYPIVIVATAISVIIPIIWFKWRGWW